MRFLAEPTIALYLMSNVKGLLPNKIKQRLECDHNKSLYLLQTSVVFGGVRQQKRFLHWKRGKVSVEWGNVGYTMWDVLCGIYYVVVEYAMWDVLWLNLNWGTTLWACLHLNEESGLEKGDLKFWLRESQEWWWWWWWRWDGENGRTPSVTAINGRPSPLSHRTGCDSSVTKHCQRYNGPRHRVLWLIWVL